MSLLDLLPKENWIHDLALRTERGEEGARGVQPVSPALLTGGDGCLAIGTLFALLDSTAGRLAARAAHPDVVVTSEMTLQSGRRVRDGEVHAVAHVLRQGRRTMTVDVRMHAGGAEGALAAIGTASFSVVSLPDGVPAPDLSEEAIALRPQGPRAGLPLLERIGLGDVEAGGPGEIEIPLTPYVRNHVDVLHGSVVALLADEAAARGARPVLGPEAATLDLSVRYLDRAGRGPVVARPELLRQSDGICACRVAIRDGGREGPLAALATATVGRG